MDPALEQALRRGPTDREIEVAALIAPGVELPPDLRVVAAFGRVLTGRVRVDRVVAVRRHPAIRSLKATRVVGGAGARVEGTRGGAAPRRGVPGATGAGCVLAFLDWGCDFAHPAFRGGDGRTRLRGIWDQRGPGDGNRWGYGRVLDRDRIDAALRAPDPYAALGYRLGQAAAHGTHVMDLAAGNGGAGAAPGVAPGAELLFVHLSTGLRSGDGDLGDSVRILEALDFARAAAGPDPLVVNMSLGRTAGEHTGRSCVEQGMDAFLEEAPGRCIVQSAGNYFGKQLHAAGTLLPGRSAALGWEVAPGDPTPNELELWYPGADRLAVELTPPEGGPGLRLRLGERAAVVAAGREVGFAYHRQCDPLNRDNHVDVFLEPSAPAGTWEVRLVAEDVVDGRWHAWVERDPGGPEDQSRFRPGEASDRGTVGTIATGRRTLVVGALDGATALPAPFSSAGPSRDGRCKPDLLAEGVGVPAARSTPPGAAPGSGGLVEMSGTSMAAPQVAGTVALLFGRAPRPLNVAETRLLVLGTAIPLEGDPMRTGAGQLDTRAALAALQCMFQDRRDAMSRTDGTQWSGPSWSGEAAWGMDGEMEAILGPIDRYRVVGWPGAPLQAPVRAGDVLIRVGPGGQPLIARVTSIELQGSVGVPPTAEVEGEDGVYAEARDHRRRVGWARRPALRFVAGRGRIVRPGQIVIRPVVPAPVPVAVVPAVPVAPPPLEDPYAPQPYALDPYALHPGEPEPYVEPEPEPWAYDPWDDEDREDQPATLRPGAPLSEATICDELVQRLKYSATRMPDPTAPSYYQALPTATGFINGAGWSGHVRAWFGRMREPLSTGARAQYRFRSDNIADTGGVYRRVVLEQGGRLLKMMGQPGFGKAIRAFNAARQSAVVQLVNQYVNESGQIQGGYDGLKSAAADLAAARSTLAGVRERYQAFLDGLQRAQVEGEKQALLAEAAEAAKLLNLVTSSLSMVETGPLGAASVLKLLSGEPVSTLLTAVFTGPDQGKLAVLEAKLAALDQKITGHKDKAFTHDIEAARRKLEGAEAKARQAMRALLEHKLKTLQVIQQLAGLETEGGGLQFFHALREYQQAVARAGAEAYQEVKAYDRWLAGDPADADRLLTEIRADLEHVRRYDLDREGKWKPYAEDAAAWLQDRFIPWVRPERTAVSRCLAAFDELRHLTLVNEAVNRVIDATGGARAEDLGRYKL